MTLPSSDVCVPAALRAESEPRPECHSGGSALHAAAEGLHKSKVEIRELGEVDWLTYISRVIRGVNCGRDRDRVITRELPSWTVRKVGYITKLSTLTVSCKH